MKYIVGIALLVLLGGALVVFMGDGNLNTGTSGDGARMSEGNEFSGSLAQLQQRGGNYRCTFSHDTEVVRSTGVVYVADEKVRGDFESETQGISVDSHMITRDGFIYTWSPIAPTGFKTVQVDTQANGTTETSGEYSDFQQSYDYSCESWSVDESKFQIPDISFVEIGA